MLSSSRPGSVRSEAMRLKIAVMALLVAAAVYFVGIVPALEGTGTFEPRTEQE
jgi:hypothetical protein